MVDAPLTTVRCPTCRAVQEWSETCRRCKCDLSLLRALASSYLRSRRHCVAALRNGRLAEASRHARRCHWLRPSRESQRLLALCALLRGDWVVAVALASRLEPSEGS